MKSHKRSIKIIKRGEREGASHVVPPPTGKEESSSDFAHNVTSTVADWVREFQHRRRAEQKRALTNLREDRARLSEHDHGLTPAEA